MNTKQIKVVIIDNGVNAHDVMQYEVVGKGKVVPCLDKVFPTEHGTLCYEVFCSVVECNECISIHVGASDDYGRFHSHNVIAALEWCLANEVSLISLSMGTSNVNEFQEYNTILSKLAQNKVVIVAAINNNNKLTYPASHKNVIGVRFDKERALPDGSFLYLQNELIGTNILVNVCTNTMNVEPYNSFAVPYFAGILYREMKYKNVSFDTLDTWMRKNAIEIRNSFSYNYYRSLFHKAHQVEEPINMLILGEYEEIGILKECFREKQYTAIDFLVEEVIQCNLINGNIPKHKFFEIYDVIYQSAEPDLTIWYTFSLNNVMQMKEFFDVIIIEENKILEEQYSCLLAKDGVVLSYLEEELNCERIVQDICKIFE